MYELSDVFRKKCIFVTVKQTDFRRRTLLFFAPRVLFAPP